MAKKRINNTFYNIDYYALKPVHKLPPDMIITGKLLNCTEENENQFDFPETEFYDAYGTTRGVKFPVRIRKELKEYCRSIGMDLRYETLHYVFHEIPEGYLYSGWGTGRKTKLTEYDLPESFVYLKNYKKHGYLQTAGVTDIVYKPSYFHNHTFKDDFLYISYSGELIINGLWEDSLYDQYVFGNDIVHVILSIEKFNPDLKDKVKRVKRQMVEQYNAYCREQRRHRFTETKEISQLEDLVRSEEEEKELFKQARTFAKYKFGEREKRNNNE